MRHLLLAVLLMLTSTAAFAHSYFVYFGTYTGASSQGIYRSRFDPHSGKLSPAELVVEIQNPSFLALHPNGKFLYAAGEMNSGGSVTAFSLDATSGALSRLNSENSMGNGPCHLSVDGSGKCLLVANYGAGSIAALSVKADGSLAPAATVIQHSGSSVHPKRQNAPHAHFITPSPDNRFALVCDLGLDQVLAYSLNPELAKLAPADPPFLKVQPGIGPRHLAFAPNGKFIYVLNELAGSISALRYDAESAAMSEVHTLSILPAGFTNQNTSAGIAVHPNGKFVYGSNRGHDSIAVLAANPDSGQLTFVEHQSSGIKTPRHFALDPSGNWMLVENQSLNTVLVFKVDPATGKLTPTSESISVGSPVCAVFVPAK